MIEAKQMDAFLSCDWGTSKFRLRLVSCQNMEILCEETSDWGIQKTHLSWENNQKASVSREHFFLNVIQEHLQRLSTKTDRNLLTIPFLLSGMASADMGIKHLPYKALPFSTDGSDLLTQELSFDALKLFIISGVQSPDDVMRGEETQLVGVFNQVKEKQLSHCFIIPGTHSKHIFVQDEKVSSFETYLSGELFALLSEKSILQSAIAMPPDAKNSIEVVPFKKGLYDSMDKNILHALFGIRTLSLFHKQSQIENYHYLNGLLIGTELQNLLLHTSNYQVHLVAIAPLASYYGLALQEFNIPFTHYDAESALIQGQYMIFHRQAEIV